MNLPSRRSDFRALLSEDPTESEHESPSDIPPDTRCIGRTPGAATTAAFVVDHDLRYLVAEGDALEAAGFRPEDFMGKTIHEVLQPELAARYERHYRQVFAGGSFAVEHEAHGRVYLSRGVPLADSERNVYAALVVSYDITESKHASLVDQRSEELLSALIENAPFGVFIADEALRLRAINRAAESALGAVESLLGRDLVDVLPNIWQGAPAAELLRQFQLTLATGETYDAPTVAPGQPHGEIIASYDWRVQRILLTDRSFGVACYLYDLTPVRRAEFVVATAAHRHAFLVDFSDAITSMTSARDVIRVASKRLGVHVGADRVAYAIMAHAGVREAVEEVWSDASMRIDGKSCRSVHHSAELMEALRHGEAVCISDVRHDARVNLFEVYERLRVGALLHVPLIKRGRLVAVLTVHHATTRAWSPADVELAKEVAERTWLAVERTLAEAALRESEERLRQVDRRKDEFLAILAHELRNPLAPIRTGLELLRVSGDTASSVARVREVMERQVGHLVRLVDDLLDVSRIASGKIRLQHQSTTLSALVFSAVEAHWLALHVAGLEIVVDLPEDPIALIVDPTRIVQVLSNLLHNAIKFTGSSGLIRITGAMAPDARHVVLTVTDSGAGIAPQTLPHIFELFVQGNAESDPDGGLGIGLGLARRLVALHGGTIEAASDGPGKGSAFTVRLPVASAVVGPAFAAPVQVSSVSRRVMVVDDNTDAADTMAMLLEALGSASCVAYDGETALRQLPEFGPELILLDIGMLGMDGYEACRRIRAALGSKVLIVALTGRGQAKDKELAAKAGFDAHLTKPVDHVTLKRLLAQPLGSSRR